MNAEVQARLHQTLEIMRSTCASTHQRTTFLKRVVEQMKEEMTVADFDKIVVETARWAARPSQQGELEILLQRHGYFPPPPPEPKTKAIRFTTEVELAEEVTAEEAKRWAEAAAEHYGRQTMAHRWTGVRPSSSRLVEMEIAADRDNVVISSGTQNASSSSGERTTIDVTFRIDFEGFYHGPITDGSFLADRLVPYLLAFRGDEGGGPLGRVRSVDIRNKSKVR